MRILALALALLALSIEQPVSYLPGHATRLTLLCLLSAASDRVTRLPCQLESGATFSSPDLELCKWSILTFLTAR